MRCPWCGGNKIDQPTVDIGVGSIVCGPRGCIECRAYVLHDRDYEFYRDVIDAIDPAHVRDGWYREPDADSAKVEALLHERESMAKDDRGLFQKYRVTRVDGSDQPGGKHANCRLFVLDLDHDPHALDALRAYALAASATRPKLARDLNGVIRQVQRRQHDATANKIPGFNGEKSQ